MTNPDIRSTMETVIPILTNLKNDTQKNYLVFAKSLLKGMLVYEGGASDSPYGPICKGLEEAITSFEKDPTALVYLNTIDNLYEQAKALKSEPEHTTFYDRADVVISQLRLRKKIYIALDLAISAAMPGKKGLSASAEEVRNRVQELRNQPLGLETLVENIADATLTVSMLPLNLTSSMIYNFLLPSNPLNIILGNLDEAIKSVDNFEHKPLRDKNAPQTIDLFRNIKRLGSGLRNVAAWVDQKTTNISGLTIEETQEAILHSLTITPMESVLDTYYMQMFGRLGLLGMTADLVAKEERAQFKDEKLLSEIQKIEKGFDKISHILFGCKNMTELGKIFQSYSQSATPEDQAFVKEKIIRAHFKDILSSENGQERLESVFIELDRERRALEIYISQNPNLAHRKFIEDYYLTPLKHLHDFSKSCTYQYLIFKSLSEGLGGDPYKKSKNTPESKQLLIRKACQILDAGIRKGIDLAIGSTVQELEADNDRLKKHIPKAILEKKEEAFELNIQRLFSNMASPKKRYKPYYWVDEQYSFEKYAAHTQLQGLDTWTNLATQLGENPEDPVSNLLKNDLLDLYDFFSSDKIFSVNEPSVSPLYLSKIENAILVVQNYIAEANLSKEQISRIEKTHISPLKEMWLFIKNIEKARSSTKATPNILVRAYHRVRAWAANITPPSLEQYRFETSLVQKAKKAAPAAILGLKQSLNAEDNIKILEIFTEQKNNKILSEISNYFDIGDFSSKDSRLDYENKIISVISNIRAAAFRKFTTEEMRSINRHIGHLEELYGILKHADTPYVPFVPLLQTANSQSEEKDVFYEALEEPEDEFHEALEQQPETKTVHNALEQQPEPKIGFFERIRNWFGKNTLQAWNSEKEPLLPVYAQDHKNNSIADDTEIPKTPVVLSSVPPSTSAEPVVQRKQENILARSKHSRLSMKNKPDGRTQ